MRSAYKLALIVFLVFAANVAISHVSVTTPVASVDSVAMPAAMEIMWSAPAVRLVVLADVGLTSPQDAPVTDTVDSARAGASVAILVADATTINYVLKAPYRAFRSQPKPRMYNATNQSVTDLEA